MPINVELLREIQAHIKEEPKRLIMEHWSYHISPGEQDISDFGLKRIVVPACGTVACIGGWGSLLRSGMSRADAFGFESTSKEGLRLFYVDKWPKRFREKFKRARTAKSRVLIACARIDAFVKSETRRTK